MIADLLDSIRSLTEIMRDETELLRTPRRAAELAELAAAKQRLVGILDARSAQLARETPGWLDTLDTETREELAEALADLRDASATNATALERHIQLSTDMLAAIASEARRLTGARHAVYGSAGGLSRIELPHPISFNTQY